MKRELGLADLIVIPQEPDDPIGHSDGMVSWLGERSVLVNDYSKVSGTFRRRLHRSLARHQVDLVELAVRAPVWRAGGDADGGAEPVELPQGSRPGDRPRLRDEGGRAGAGNSETSTRGYAVEAVECRELAEEGGSIHCVTWQVQLAESP